MTMNRMDLKKVELIADKLTPKTSSDVVEMDDILQALIEAWELGFEVGLDQGYHDGVHTGRGY